jgi:hypothetical protein
MVVIFSLFPHPFLSFFFFSFALFMFLNLPDKHQVTLELLSHNGVGDGTDAINLAFNNITRLNMYFSHMKQRSLPISKRTKAPNKAQKQEKLKRACSLEPC